jgi:glycosyltransferase involved in cell wall biosynthesis
LSLDKQVCFSGFLQGLALVELLHQHRIMVVPSIAPEPFGIVAIEAIACGLVPVVSGTGGLPEAIGRCGLVVPPFDSIALADAISRLDDAELFAALLAEGSRHMVRHTRDSVAQAYLKVIKSARSKWS